MIVLADCSIPVPTCVLLIVSVSFITDQCVVSVYLPIAAPEKFAAQNLSAVVTFASENVPCLSIEMRVCVIVAVNTLL